MKKFILPLLVLIFIFPALWALFHPGFFLTDDGNSMVIRFSAFYEALRYGQFPVRFLPRLNFSYGYPVANFLYPLFLYLGVPIKIIGFDFVTTIKIILGGSVLFSGLFTFLWLREKFSNPAAFTGSIVYALFPYHIWDLYKRGSVGELVGLAIIPFILWQIERKSIALAGVGIALLILGHNVLALLFLPLIFLYILLTKKYSYKKLMTVFLLGFGCSVFFWIPALLERKHTIFDKIVVAEFATYFLQPTQYMLFGLIFFVAVCVSFYFVWKKKKILYWFFWLLSVVSVLLTLPISYLFWKYIPGTNFIQFPFRLLSLTTLGVAFLVTLSIQEIQKKYTGLFVSLFIVITYISVSTFVMPQTYQEYPDTFYSTNQDSTTIKNEYMPKWVKQMPFTMPNEKVLLVQGEGTIKDIISNGNKISFAVDANKKSVVQINTIYFPGWKALVNGKEQKILYENTYGVIQIPLEKGEYTVMAKFTETQDRLVADIISIVFFLLAGIIFVFEMITKKKYAA